MTPARIRAMAKEEGCHVPESDDEPILFPEPYGRASLAMALEDEFGIEELPEYETERCLSVNDWVDLVERIKR